MKRIFGVSFEGKNGQWGLLNRNNEEAELTINTKQLRDEFYLNKDDYRARLLGYANETS